MTTSCVPSASARSTISRLNDAPAHRRLGALEQHEVARGARDVRGVDLDLRPLDRARAALDELDLRPGRLEVEEVLGVDAGEARGGERGAEELERRRGGVAGVVPAGEGAHESRSAQAVGAMLPDQRRHPDHGTSWVCDPPGDQHPARGRRRGRRLRLHPQGPPGLAGRVAVPRGRAARPHGRAPGPGLPRRRPPRRALRPRRPRAGRGPGRALPRRAPGRRARDRPRARGRRRPGGVPARRLPRPRRARRLPRAPRGRDPRRAVQAPRRRPARRPASCAPRCGARRARARPITPTSAACSSTRSPSRRSRSTPARCTRAWTRTSCSPRRSSTTSGARASSPSAPRSA